jgi:hypothetical protein
MWSLSFHFVHSIFVEHILVRTYEDVAVLINICFCFIFYVGDAWDFWIKWHSLTPIEFGPYLQPSHSVKFLLRMVFFEAWQWLLLGLVSLMPQFYADYLDAHAFNLSSLLFVLEVAYIIKFLKFQVYFLSCFFWG